MLVVNKQTTNYKTWDPHGSSRWNIGTVPEHYIFHHVYIHNKREERTKNKVKLPPHNRNTPHTVPEKDAITTSRYLIEEIKTQYDN